MPLLGLHAVHAFSQDGQKPAPANWSDRNEQEVLLEVFINGQPKGLVGAFRQRGKALYATRRELTELGLEPGQGDREALVSLASIPTVSYQVNTAAQSVSIAASPTRLKPAVLTPAQPPSTAPQTNTGLGAVLNYDIAGTSAAGRVSGAGLFDARVFSPWGVVSSGLLAQVGSGQAGPSSQAIRLDSTYTYSDPDSMQRVRVGDFISAGLPWTRPVRLGGVQFARDFSLRPDLVTFPVRSIAGAVAVPSTVDVLINGVQQLSTAAPPGPFELRQLPVVNGANDVSVVVTNAIGQSVSQTLPIYSSNALLRAELDAYSIEVGAIRLAYGVWSDDYRAPAASASYRRGMTDWLTLSAHGEGSQDLAMAGAGASVALGNFGVASLAIAGSSSRGRHGVQGYAALERITPHLSLSASVLSATGDFVDLASLYADPVSTRLVRAGIGTPLGGGGSLGLTFTLQRRAVWLGADRRTIVPPSGPLSGPLFGPTFALPLRLSLLSASYSVPAFAGRALFYATAFHDFDNRNNSGCVFGLTLPLGSRASASAGVSMANGRSDATLQASRSVVQIGDVGGQGLVEQGRPSRLYAEGDYQSPWALLSAGVDRTGGQTALRTRASGALVFADGGLFATNTVADSFAIVDTDGAAGIPVLYENRLVERTGESGRVLIPNLRSFELNRISIDPTDIPLDAEVGAVSQLVRPQDRSGAVVRFPVRSTHSALLRLVDDRGAPLPAGARVQPESGGEPTVVGYDGEAFVGSLAPQTRLVVTVPGGGRCIVTVNYRAEHGVIPKIGPLPCPLVPAS